MLHKTTQSSSYICILLLRQTNRLLARCQDRGGYGTSLIGEGPARRPWEKTTMVVVRGQGAPGADRMRLQPAGLRVHARCWRPSHARRPAVLGG